MKLATKAKFFFVIVVLTLGFGVYGYSNVLAFPDLGNSNERISYRVTWFKLKPSSIFYGGPDTIEVKPIPGQLSEYAFKPYVLDSPEYPYDPKFTYSITALVSYPPGKVVPDNFKVTCTILRNGQPVTDPDASDEIENEWGYIHCKLAAGK